MLRYYYFGFLTLGVIFRFQSGKAECGSGKVEVGRRKWEGGSGKAEMGGLPLSALS
ncbi:MAG: hypothetical protein R2828_26405 [Saprospiraceae bacterium]